MIHRRAAPAHCGRAETSVSETPAKAAYDRTDDPVRMYLREMGSVELLSREGEIAIAKRIEAGRETMIAGLCESPLTFQAIIIWREELNEGATLLREIIDLETTYSGPEAKAAPAIAAEDVTDMRTILARIDGRLEGMERQAATLGSELVALRRDVNALRADVDAIQRGR